MLDIKFIRENPDKVKEGIRKKQASVDVDSLLALDKQKRDLLTEIEALRSRKNKLGRENISEAQEIKVEIKKIGPKLEKIEKDFNTLMFSLPNLPLDDVPEGKDESCNAVLRIAGAKPKFSFLPRDYLDLAEKLDLIDVERASKVSGSRFGYLKGEAALLEFGLVNLAMNTLTKDGFIPVVPPAFIKSEMMKAMGYIDSEDDLAERYFFEKDGLFLVGTSEQSIGPMHANEVFEEKDLPKRYAAFSSCFRREAGSYGKDTKGILRVHQFDKVEMFSFCHPEKSYEEHQFLLKMAEKLMQNLEIPYRVIQLCTGDLARPSAATYDIESWMPGQNTYRETHSISNCTDFQARRLNIRYRASNGKLYFVHTLNGTAFAIGRILIALIENYQQKNGSVKIPDALQKYLKIKAISRHK